MTMHRYKRAGFITTMMLLLATTFAACSDLGSAEESGPDVDVADNAADDFPEGSRMRELAEAGEITIGVKFDQAEVSSKSAVDDAPHGFDPEIAEILAASLGIAPVNITWKETISDNREAFLQKGEVDLVVASYSITPERSAVVGQAGPYYQTGQQVLVRSDDDSIQTLDDVKGKEICSVTGSTSLEQIEAAGATGRGFDTFSECVDQVLNGTVDAMSTDGALLLGYAAEHPDELKVVVEPFSEENWGVGYSLDHPEMCEWITDTLQSAMDDGTWAEAFDGTLGKSGVEAPEPPTWNPCP